MPAIDKLIKSLSLFHCWPYTSIHHPKHGSFAWAKRKLRKVTEH